ncbi:MAG: protein adenylyltransferase SelO [Verrucomicrobiales bacterium]
MTPTSSSISPKAAGWRLEHSYTQLPARFFAHVKPTPVATPKVVLLNHALANGLGLDAEALSNPENASWFTGNTLPPGSAPLAQAYAGHQFGNFVILGDGRAILLGEQITPQGERFDIQLKGPGRTPYSRGGDGRAALGPMLREYIISEAMNGFGIPTTRSLAVATTGESVYRETPLPGAILTRVAASHLRVGTFEWAAATREPENLRALADYTLRRHYPELLNSEQPYAALLRAILHRQAKLVARWMEVGFIHGVMNTDNMALSGETIDYGPCAFMDVYHSETVFSSIDRHGRYAFGNQPKIAHWNLSCLASAMLPLLHADEEKAIALGNEILGTFPALFQAEWLASLRAKLGLFNEESGDGELAENLLKIMQDQEMDYTNTFRDLSSDSATADAPSPDMKTWRDRWQDRLRRQPQGINEARGLMRGHNPAFIPRNYKVEEALTAATEQGNLTPVKKLVEVIANPFAYDRDLPEFSSPPPSGNCGYQTFCGT